MADTYPIVRLVIYNETIEFRDNDVIEARVIQEIHPVGIELPASTCRIRVWLDDTIVDENNRTLRDKFKPFSDGVYHQSMSTGLTVDVSEQVFDVEHFIGRFYLEDWNNTKEGELELVCTDAIGVLDSKTYLGNFYEAPTPVDTIISDIFKQVDFAYALDADVAAKYLKGYIPGNITLREAVQQVLFACGAFIINEEAGHLLRFKSSKIPISRPVYPGYYYDDATALYDSAKYTDLILDEYISNAEKTDSQELTILHMVTGVEITSHDYSKGTTMEEIFSAYLQPGDYMIVYPKPYWHVEATGVGDVVTYLATPTGEVLISPDSGTYPDVIIYTIYGEFEFGVNYVYLHVPVVDPIPQAVISGKPWLDATQKFTWSNPDAVKIYSEGSAYWENVAPPNVWTIDNATLVPFNRSGSEETVEEVLARVAAYANLRYQQKTTLFPRTDITLGEVDIVESLYGKSIVGAVERITSDLTGGYLIETEFVGVERDPTVE